MYKYPHQRQATAAHFSLLILRVFALARPSDDEASLLCRHSSLWSCASCFAISLAALDGRLTSGLPTSAYVLSPTTVLRLATDHCCMPCLRQPSNAFANCSSSCLVSLLRALARSGSQPLVLRNYELTRMGSPPTLHGSAVSLPFVAHNSPWNPY